MMAVHHHHYRPIQQQQRRRREQQQQQQQSCQSLRFLSLCVIVSLFTLFTPTYATSSRAERARAHPEVFDFPFIGRGDPDHSFLHPYMPSSGGDPINGWFQLGTTTVSRARTGRDVVRLTGAAQGNQGVLYNSIKTETNNWNGYIDIQIEAARDSHEPADGMGLFFVKDRPELGSAMGITDRFQGLGLVIDTFSNSRTRHVPYLYAYVSDGTKPYNPDTDGSDTELTRGCQLEMNTVTRIYVQFLDGNLHVGVAMNPRTPHRWHTCFKAFNVKMPFSDGGYLAFAGETGHFFAMHEVHDAAFVDESAHSGQNYHSEYHNQEYGEPQHHQQYEQQEHQHQHQQQQQQQSQSHHDEQQHHYDEHHQKRTDGKVMDDRSDPSSRIHKGNSGEESLSGSLDLQVYEVFNSVATAMRNLHDKESEEAKLRMDGVRDITGHLVQEVEKQKTEMTSLIQLLQHLRESSKGLSYESDKFSSQIKNLHSAIDKLRQNTDDLSISNDDLHAHLTDHHLRIEGHGTGGNGILVLFLVVQLLIIAGFVVSRKVNLSTKKAGRMV